MEPGDVAYALWRGPGLVLVAHSDHWGDIIGPGVVGLPIREWATPDHCRQVVRLMERSLATGMADAIEMPFGHFACVPIPDRPGFLVTRFAASVPIRARQFEPRLGDLARD